MPREIADWVGLEAGQAAKAAEAEHLPLPFGGHSFTGLETVAAYRASAHCGLGRAGTRASDPLHAHSLAGE